MTILDSFFFVLKADSSDAVKGITDTGEKFDDLKSDVGKGTTDISRHFDTMSHNVGGSLLEVGKGIAGLAAGVLAGLASVDALAGGLERVVQKASDAQSLGVAIGDYDALAQSFNRAGIEASDFRDLMVDVNEAVGEGISDPASQRAKTFSQLGIALKDTSGHARNAADIITDLATAADKINPQQFTFLTRQLGINDPKTIQLLSQGSLKLREQLALAKQNGVLTDDQAKAALRLRDAQQQLTASFAQMAEQVAAGLTPAIAALLEVFNKVVAFVQEHKTFIVSLIGVAAVGAVWMFRSALLQLIPALTAIAIRSAVAFAPLLLAGVALLLIAGIVEDLYLYFTDPTANTVTGALAKKFESVRDFLAASKAEVLGLIQGFKDFAKNAGESVDDLAKKFEEFWSSNNVTEKLKGWYEAFRNLGLQVGNLFRNVFAGAINSLVDALPDKLRSTLGITHMLTSDQANTKNTAAQTYADVAAIMPNAAGATAAANMHLNTAASSPINSLSNSAVAPRGGSTTNTEVNISKVEVNTQATDADGMAQHAAGALTEQLRTAVHQADDGINH